jgi:ketosteroid isomerase-like protein
VDEHPNATRVRSFAEAVAAGDLMAALDLFDEHAVHRVGGKTPLSGTYHGPQAIGELLASLAELTGGTIRMTVDDVVGAGGYGAMFATVTAERVGKHLDDRAVVVFKVNDDGKFQESWFLYSDQRGFDDFFS